MFIGIFSYGSWVLTGVVEEKQSRVVEVVLSTVRPRDLLIGKVLGIGLLALPQLVILVAAGIAVAADWAGSSLPADDRGRRDPAAHLVHPRVRVLLDRARLRSARWRRGRRRRQNASMPVTLTATPSYILCRSLVTRRSRRRPRPGDDVPPAVGADGRPAADGPRRDPALADRAVAWCSCSARSGSCSSSAAGSTRARCSRPAAGSSSATPGAPPADRRALQPACTSR